MLCFMYILLLALGLVWSRDPLRARAVPTISNSLVNLGKMDITFYIGKENGVPAKENLVPINPKPLPIIDECLCNSLRNSPPLGGSSSILNKILSSNDLFNLDKEVTYGPQCCESHEESTITFEFGPKDLKSKSFGSALKPFQSISPIIFDSILPSKRSNSPFGQSLLKPKAIEIFLFPKNKEGLDNKNKLWNFGPKKTIKKDIKIVGDKDLKSTFIVKNSNDVKDSSDDKYSFDAKNSNDGNTLKSVKSSYDLKNLDSLKYETVQPVTMKKEIGIKDQNDDSKSDEKEDKQKDVSNISKTQ